MDAPYALKRFAKEHDIPWSYWFSGEPREDTRFWQRRYNESPEYAEQVDFFRKVAKEINEAQGAQVVEPNPDGLGLRTFAAPVVEKDTSDLEVGGGGDLHCGSVSGNNDDGDAESPN